MFRKLLLNLLFCSLVFCLPLYNEEEGLTDWSQDGEVVFGESNKRTEDYVARKTDLEVNPEELGDYFEGDILLTSYNRNGMLDKTHLWPNGTVPYEFDSKVSSVDKQKIFRAMEEFHKWTCIR